MNQLRYLINAELQNGTPEIRSNGTLVNTYTKVNDYQIQLQELVDEVSASIYGANINKTFRINSPKNKLEVYLKSKMNSTSDNVSDYYLLIDNKRYKIVNVKSKYVDIELL